MKHVVITGASSFIGTRLCDAMLRRGWEVTAVVRPGTAPDRLPAGVRTVGSAMEDHARLGEMCGRCDCFVHLAWSGTRGAARMDAALQQQNLEHSLLAVRSVLDAGCGRVITAGSQAEYGPHTDQISEESECRPNTEYGKAKLAFYEQTAALCRQSGAACKEPRFFSLYGPGDFEGTMVMSILRAMAENQPCKLTEGRQLWDFLYIDDAVEALCRLAEKDCPDGAYNFGSGDARQLKDYVLEMARVTGSNSSLDFGAIPYPETGMVSLWPDVSKLKRELHWAPQVSFAEGIRTILEASII